MAIGIESEINLYTILALIIGWAIGFLPLVFWLRKYDLVKKNNEKIHDEKPKQLMEILPTIKYIEENEQKIEPKIEPENKPKNQTKKVKK
jgi:hypothetical protein